MITIEKLKEKLLPLKLNQVAKSIGVAPRLLYYYLDRDETIPYSLVVKLIAYLKSMGQKIEDN